MKKENIWLVAIVILLAFFLFGGAGMMPWGGYGMMGMMGNYWTGGWIFMWIFMGLTWILIIVALVLGIIWLTKQIQKK